MIQNIEELSPTTRKIKINIPNDVIKSETDSIYNQIRATASIPGFRAGKAPQSILVKKYGKNVEAQVIEKVVPKYYLEAIREAKIEPVNYPNIDDKLELKPNEPLSFTVTVEIKPEIANLSYEGIVLKEKTFEVKDEDVDSALKKMQESRALYTVSEGEIGDGDMAIIDSEAFIEGELKDELTYREYPLILGTAEMPEEFTNALKGRKKGDKTEVKISFEDTHHNKTIAGKEVLFRISIHETKKKNIPPLDDEFAKESGCSNLDELKEKIRNNIIDRKKSQINLEYKKEIINELTKRHDFDVPESMVQGEIESIIHQAKQTSAARGEKPASDEELKKEHYSSAKDNVKSVLLLEAFGKKEGITVNDADIKNAIDEIASRNNLKAEEVQKLYAVREGSMDALKSRLFADKVLDFILEKSTIEKN